MNPIYFKSAFTLIVLMTLSACQTSSQMSEKQKITLIEKSKSSCQAYGYTVGTENFVKCVQLEIYKHDNEATARRARTAAALSETGRSMQTNRSVNCKSNTYGGTTNTRCY